MQEVTLWTEENIEGRNQPGSCVTIEFMGTRYSTKIWGGFGDARLMILRQVAANLGVEHDTKPCNIAGDFINQLREMRRILEQASHDSKNNEVK